MTDDFQFLIDPELDPALVEQGRLLFARPTEFVIGCARLDQLPPGDRPEICVAGRSNVGKSSLINALTGRKALARASNTPGRTQQLNYFNADDRLFLVDLPGYGYAQAPKQIVDAWQDLLKSYLRGRASLRRAFVLVDGRHGPKAVDREYMKLLGEAAVNFQVVLTKADKPRSPDLEKAIEATKAELANHPAAYPHIRVTSSETGRGVPELRGVIAGLVAEAGGL